MAINVDGYGATAPATGPAQRLQTDARQTRWLYEVEHAMLLQAGKKPTGAGRGAVADEGRRPVHERDAAESDAAQRGDAGAAVAPRTAALPPVEAPSGNGVPAAAAPDGATHAAAHTGAVARGDGAGPAHGVAAAQARAGAVEAVVAASAAAQDGATPSPAAVQSLYGVAAAGLQRGAAGGGDTALTVQKTGAATAGWTLAGSAAADPASQRPGSARPEQSEETPAPAERREEADAEQYADRLLHVYRDADGVQAWLRDAALGAAQARQVAQAMAVELGAAGAPLAALTVNGQRLPLPLAPATGDGHQQRDDYTGDNAAPPSPEATSPWTINANGAV